MRVLHAAAELFPWVKTGGLGDVLAALPPALTAAGIDTRLVLPGFTALLDGLELAEITRLRTPFATERVRIALARLPESNVSVYLVDHPAFYDRPGGLYADPDGQDWPDNHRRFGLLGWAAAALARGAAPDWRPEILHCHDWHAGLAPAYLRADGSPVPSVFTVHNLAYQGWFPGAVFGELALPPEFFAMEGVEFFGGVSFMKAGLYYADRLTTVSPTYAREIQTPAFGMNFDGLLRTRADALSGILNGVDPAIWSPDTDAALPMRYSVDNAATGKAAAKAALQRHLSLDQRPDTPLFGVVTRLTWQKGMDLLRDAVPALVAQAGQLAMLGSGDADLEQAYASLARMHPGRVGVLVGYDETLSHLIMAGSDVVVVPSRFEPCGLTQLYALSYGALPLVRRTGGLADTVVDANSVTLADNTATGFHFETESPAALTESIQRALALYPERETWRRIMRRAMTRDFSWAAAARQYATLYSELVAETTQSLP